MSFLLPNWYWIVAGSKTEVFSSASGTLVSLPNATYQSWQQEGNQPTSIDTYADLFNVLSADPATFARCVGTLVATGALTLPQQATALLALGFTLTSTGTPALNATYAATAEAQAQIADEIDALLLNGLFTNGTTSLPWPDATGAAHTFGVTQFKAFATAMADFAGGCMEVINGVSTTLPTASATIA